MLNRFKQLLCAIFGHKWEVYEYKTGYWSYDIEMAGHCKRCGFDTHEQIKKEDYPCTQKE